MRNLLLGALLLVLAACASDPSVRWAQQQQLTNSAMETLIQYRAPCVDAVAYPGAGPDHPLCRVDDAAWDWAYSLSQRIDALLQVADQAALAGDGQKVILYLDLVENLLLELQRAQLQLQGPAS